MTKCRVCSAQIKPFMTFGQMPIANAFMKPEEWKDNYRFEMAVASCPECATFQITEQPDPEAMFHENYAFFTRTSKRMVEHFANYAGWVKENYLKEGSFVVEIGCNDGAMLENFSKAGYRHLGIEPSANVAEVAESYGVKTLVSFFGKETAIKVRGEYSQADAVLAANVICHIPDMNDVAAGIAEILSDKGVFVFEEPYLGAMIEKGSYDQIYDEHVYIFSATSVRNIFARHGLELINLVPQETHGGSMRYVIGRKGARPVEKIVLDILEKEKEQGLDIPGTYDDFRRRCEENRDALVKIIRDLKAAGHRVVGYAATSKSTTVLNYCGLGPDDIEYISDTTPIKHNTLTPGTKIPVKPYEEFKADYPDYAVLFAWNHEKEIMANEKDYEASGGKWIKFVPEVTVT